MFDDSTRSAVVTGAARGIGLACARRLRSDGCRVYGVDLTEASLDAVRDEFDGVAALDVRDVDAVDALPGRFGRVDILVNSAGIVGPNVPMHEVPIDQWRDTIDINLTGTFAMMRAFVPGMVEAGWGRIVNIASIAGKEGNPNLSAYSASKAAVIGLTKSVGKELATTGVLVNAIAPAVIATEMNASNTPEVLAYMISKIPMSRTGDADEVAALVAWLSSDECSFSTGACYDISGGRATY